MNKSFLYLLVILLCSIGFISCEKIPNMTETIISDDEIIETPQEMDTTDDLPMTGIPVVINELMADNDNIIADPQGDYDDWLELYNPSDSAVKLTGLYLSDKEDNPTKWQFPDNTEIAANGYLIVWLDEDHDNEEATEGLHANFKLSKSGELVLFVDSDTEGNEILDSVVFGEQETDKAYGRLPNGTGDFQVVVATPGEANRSE